MPVFPESKDLRMILESHGWTLYERVEAEDNPAFNYLVVQRRGPAEQYEVGKRYYLLPALSPGDDLGEKTHIAKPPTLFMGAQINLGKYCTIEFKPDKVLVHHAVTPLELPSAIAVAAFREGFAGRNSFSHRELG